MAAAVEEGKVKIHGKTYLTVAYRVDQFRKEHPTWTLHSEIISIDDKVVTMKAGIYDDTGRLIGMGHAEERRDASQINRTSALENCETSAIGRALAATGYGGTEYASANEVENAIHQQRSTSVISAVIEEMGIKAAEGFDAEETANAIIDYVNDEQLGKAMDTWANLLKDHKILVWKMLPSKPRSVLKKEGA